MYSKAFRALMIQEKAAAGQMFLTARFPSLPHPSRRTIAEFFTFSLILTFLQT
jgi:hypothetical protein